MKRVCFVILIALLLPASVRAQNFTGASQEILLAAERARIHSAEYWSGQPLPGRWSTPCPIEVSYSGSTLGRTRFTYGSGEVYGWDMQVAGSRQSILNDVIPHEVDHAVRASLVRHPMPRWLDEGAATLFESEAVRIQVHREAHAALAWFAETDLDEMDYPRDSRRTSETYAAGLTLVETLLERGTPAQLLEFMKDSRRVREKLPEHYGITDRELLVAWRRHVQVCPPARCYVPWPGFFRPVPRQSAPVVPSPAPFTRQPPPAPVVVDNRPVLDVWVGLNCAPCRALEDRYATDAGFRRQLAPHAGHAWIEQKHA